MLPVLCQLNSVLMCVEQKKATPNELDWFVTVCLRISARLNRISWPNRSGAWTQKEAKEKEREKPREKRSKTRHSTIRKRSLMQIALFRFIFFHSLLCFLRSSRFIRSVRLCVRACVCCWCSTKQQEKKRPGRQSSALVSLLSSFSSSVIPSDIHFARVYFHFNFISTWFQRIF